ncbi:hypothetical protein LV779_05685, partial [Streptomyces thinghirensis]|nr:hypothetical protein [Streptomyces thinghirensis]
PSWMLLAPMLRTTERAVAAPAVLPGTRSAARAARAGCACPGGRAGGTRPSLWARGRRGSSSA